VAEKLAVAIVPGVAKLKAGVGRRVCRRVRDVLKVTEAVVKVECAPERARPRKS